MANDEDRVNSNLAIKIGVAGIIGLGALASGLFISRRGRHLIKEAMEGRRRTTVEDRALDALWGDRVLGRRDIDVDELDQGTLAVLGEVRSEDERRRALAFAARTPGVNTVVDQLQVRPERRRPPPIRSREVRVNAERMLRRVRHHDDARSRRNREAPPR